MSAGATKDYNYAQKNNWRNWEWNRVKGRLKKRGVNPRDSLILYLAGPQDNDRLVATKKGFLNHNVIAVDNCQGNINRIRKAGGLAIYGDIADVLISWSPNPRHQIDAVLIDLCGGIGRYTIEKLYPAIVASPGARAGAVVAINHLRGRDAIGPKLVAWLQTIEETERACGLGILDARRELGIKRPPRNKHRGSLAWMLWVLLTEHFIGTFSLDADAVGDNIYLNNALLRHTFMRRIPSTKPQIHTYRSSNLYYDSVVFRKDVSNNNHSSFSTIQPTESLQKTIAATLAHRTMRGG